MELYQTVSEMGSVVFSFELNQMNNLHLYLLVFKGVFNLYILYLLVFKGVFKLNTLCLLVFRGGFYISKLRCTLADTRKLIIMLKFTKNNKTIKKPNEFCESECKYRTPWFHD